MSTSTLVHDSHLLQNTLPPPLEARALRDFALCLAAKLEKVAKELSAVDRAGFVKVDIVDHGP